MSSISSSNMPSILTIEFNNFVCSVFSFLCPMTSQFLNRYNPFMPCCPVDLCSSSFVVLFAVKTM